MMGMEPGMYEWVVYTRNQCCMSEKDDLESELFVRVVHNRNQCCTSARYTPGTKIARVRT